MAQRNRFKFLFGSLSACLATLCAATLHPVTASKGNEVAVVNPMHTLPNTSMNTIWAAGILSKLRQDGFVFIRNSPFKTAEDLAELKFSLDSEPGDDDIGKEYGRRGVFDRAEKAPGIFNVVGDVGQAHIFPHSEGAYMPSTASYIMFACPSPAPEGGTTPAVNIQRVQQEIQHRLPSLYAKILQHGVWYVRFYPREDSREFALFTEANYPTMRSRYGNMSREAIESELRSQDATWIWYTNGSRELSRSVHNETPWHSNLSEQELDGAGTGLQVWWWMPGFYFDDDETPLWFNQIAIFDSRYYRFAKALDSIPRHWRPFNSYIGDGHELTDEEYDVLREIHMHHEQLFTWQAGDLLVLDNFRFMHGRHPFQGHRECVVGYGPSKEWVSKAQPKLPHVCAKSETVRNWHPPCDIVCHEQGREALE